LTAGRAAEELAQVEVRLADARAVTRAVERARARVSTGPVSSAGYHVVL
jgi:hypothetical protein